MARNARSLREVLQQRSLAVRVAVEEEVRRVLDTHTDESAYVSSVVSRFSIKIPQFDFDLERIKKVEDYQQMPGSHFVGEVIFTDRSYKAWVVNFGIPYVGDILNANWYEAGDDPCAARGTQSVC